MSSRPTLVQRSFASSLARERGTGSSLAKPVQSRMERAFGADLSGVRVHTGGRADKLSRSINAKAFTTGNDIFFRKGTYNPNTSGGQRLLAHELSHVQQQRSCGAGTPVVQRVLVAHTASAARDIHLELAEHTILQIITNPSTGIVDKSGQNLLDAIKHKLSHVVDAGDDITRLGTHLSGMMDFLNDRLVAMQTDDSKEEEIEAMKARIRTPMAMQSLLTRLADVGERYEGTADSFTSHADPTLAITEHFGVITAASTSNDRWFGKIHALVALEYLDNGVPKTVRCDISGGAKGGEVAPIAVIDIQGDSTRLQRLAGGENKRSWLVSQGRIDAGLAKARDVQRINQSEDSESKYIYRRTGRSMLDLKNKSINCARYVEKILSAAGIQASSGWLFSTPQEIATGKKLSKKWGPSSR